MELILRPSSNPRSGYWALQLRNNTGPETEYRTLCRVDHDTARHIIEAGPVTWLFGQPDWAKIEQDDRVEKAKQLEAEARRLRYGVDHPPPGFTDEAGNQVTVGDRVVYFTSGGGQVGIVEDVLQDGDAQVTFESGWRPRGGMVKWSQLRKLASPIANFY